MNELASDMPNGFDEIVREVRRQGRAAIAAQAAAESCLEAIEKLKEAIAKESEDDEEHADLESDGIERVVRALMPFFDAFDRIVEKASRASRGPSRRSWRRWLGDPGQEAEALAQGLSLLSRQLESILLELEVKVDRRVGLPFDPGIHRVVEVRPASSKEEEGCVLEIVRSGFVMGDRILREAEVVASRFTAPSEGRRHE